ncbi:MAG TPA: Mur ligase family protein, partial [Actinomycetota bacterium]|nr:Mur ligase family protein [Actinomycetota bacterium]
MKLSLVSTLLGGPQTTSDIEVTDLAYDSRHVGGGSLFFCISGRSFDGHDFAQDAISGGAIALVVERPLDIDVPQIVVPQVRDAMTAFAAPFYGTPSNDLKVLGVTGTNGKTTTTFMAHSIFRTMGDISGLIGTVETRVGDTIAAGVRTTPESIDIQRLLRSMVSEGARSVAMEVTSEGMAERRLVGTRFRCSVFTNLSQDHLNYHGSMESYFSAKARLFSSDYSDSACVNIDDGYGARLAAQISIP